jgi:hypothetical protein
MTPFDIDCADAPFQAARHDAEEREPADSQAEGQRMNDQDQAKPPERCPRCETRAVIGGLQLFDGRPSCGMCAETEDPDAPAAYVIGDPLPSDDSEEAING